HRDARHGRREKPSLASARHAGAGRPPPKRNTLRRRRPDPQRQGKVARPAARAVLRHLTAFTPGQEASMSTKIAVNLPVKDLGQSTRFFAELGLARNDQLSDKNMEAIVVSDDIHVLLVVEPQFKAITKKEIPDTAITSEAILQLQVESRQRVDDLADQAFAAGAHAANPPNDQGFLYGRSFRDLDGHHWDVFCIDPPPQEPQR